jgi:hypothetical protein
MDNEEPNRDRLLKLHAEPMMTKSRTEREEPILENPYTEIADPNREKLLIDRELPM